MLCPQCKHRETQVVDSRDVHDGVRRRRECLSCKHRFTTYERTEPPQITVTKKSGSPERFNPEKIRRGILIACKNRPVSRVQIDELVETVERQVYETAKESISSEQIGDFVRDALRGVDEIAYVRFVSVYQAFSNLSQFSQTIDRLPAPSKEHPNA